jgi:hypothetical protein
MKVTAVQPGDTFDNPPDRIYETLERVKKLYFAAGYNNFSILPTVTCPSSDRVVVRFKVVEARNISY